MSSGMSLEAIRPQIKVFFFTTYVTIADIVYSSLFVQLRFSNNYSYSTCALCRELECPYLCTYSESDLIVYNIVAQAVLCYTQLHL